MKFLIKHSFLFLVGGICYYFIEVLFRGFSHISMFVCGGICFILIGLLNQNKKYNIPVIYQMIIGSIIITVLEFITGYLVNIKLGLHVWNYSNIKCNVLGQICLVYSMIWFFISLFAILFDDFLRYKIFSENYPNYKLL